MKRAIRLGRQYWLLSVTILVSILGLILQLVGWKYAAHWLLGLMDLLAAIVWLGHAWKELQSGSYRVNYVAIIAVVTAVVVHAYWVGIALVAAQSLLVILLARLTRRAHHELDLLDEVEPQMAQVLQGRKLSEVKASSVVAGSKFTVGPQDTVPADGVILEGSATVDETFLTGEPRPTAVGVDAHVLAGSRVTEGNLTVRATRDYKNSQYSQLRRIARGAAGQPGPFAHQAAVFNLAFTALAVVIAIVGWVLGGDAVNFLDVLVVAAPAGLIWAVPLAIQAGLARTLQHGVYVRTGSVLERLAALQSIAFAQTGIITTGDMQLDAVTAVAPHDKPTVLSIAAALLQSSGSTQARAVSAAATAANLKLRRLKRVRELTGSVRQATISGTVYYIGDRGSLEANGLVFPPKLKADAKPSLYVVTDEAILGRLTFSDAVRPETIQTLERLHDFDIRKTFLMAESGHAAGEALADTVGIREVIALHTTADKLRTLEAVHKRPMAFVGDGVADATLMSAVDIGISIGARASSAASEAASVIVLRDNLALVAVMIAIARRTFGIARQAVAIVTGLSVLFMILFAIAHFPAIYGVILAFIIEAAGLLLALRAHRSKLNA